MSNKIYILVFLYVIHQPGFMTGRWSEFVRSQWRGIMNGPQEVHGEESYRPFGGNNRIIYERSVEKNHERSVLSNLGGL